MTKTYSTGGVPSLRITIQTIINCSDFARALCEHSYNGDEIDFDSLTKTEAKAILTERIPWHGRMGSYQGLEDLGDDQEQYNEIFSKAKEWVIKNYPYLATATKP